MSQTNINIRIDAKLKNQFDNLCKELGLTMTAAFNIFAKATVRNQGIPFDVSLQFPNKETIDTIENTEKGIGLSKSFNNVDDLFGDLDA